MHHMELEGVGGHAVFLKIHSDKEEGGKERLGFKTDRQKKLDANSVLKSTEMSHYAVKAQMPSSFLKNDNCPFLKELYSAHLHPYSTLLPSFFYLVHSFQILFGHLLVSFPLLNSVFFLKLTLNQHKCFLDVISPLSFSSVGCFIITVNQN